MSQKLLTAILAHAKVAPLLSDDHFSVDGTLFEAWASFKSFRLNASVHDASTPDGPAPPPPPGAQYAGQAADEATRSGAGDMATGTESDGSKGEGNIGRNVERTWRGETWSNATHDSVTDPEARLYRAHACGRHGRAARRTRHDRARLTGLGTTRQAGYAVRQRKRKLVEEPFGWGKTVGPIAKTTLRGLGRVGAQFTLTMAAYNLARLPRLLTA